MSFGNKEWNVREGWKKSAGGIGNEQQQHLILVVFNQENVDFLVKFCIKANEFHRIE